MKKSLTTLMSLCPGRVAIELDRHKIYNETASDVIERDVNEYGEFAQEMIETDTIIRLECVPVDKPMPVIVIYHFDLHEAIKLALKQIKEWQSNK